MPHTELAEHLNRLVQARLINNVGEGTFAFRHTLTREAVYHSVLRRDRRAFHRAVAEALAQVYAGALDDYLPDLAYHYAEAEDWPQALSYARQAAERARRLFAPHEAVEHLSRALEAVRHLARNPPADLLRARGQAYETLGQFEHALGDYEAALRVARLAEDRTDEWQLLLDLGELWAGRDYVRTGEYFRAALELAVSLNDPARHAHSLNRVGNWHLNYSRQDEALPYHQQALTIFEAEGDRLGLAQTVDLLALAEMNLGDMVQGRAHYQRAVDLFRELDDRRGLVSSLSNMAEAGPTLVSTSYMPGGTLAESAALAEEALRLARQIGWGPGEAYACIVLGATRHAQGEVGQGVDLFQAALRKATAIEHIQWMTFANCGLSALYLELLAPAQAEQHVQAALRLAPTLNSAIWKHFSAAVHGGYWLARREYARAVEVLSPLVVPKTAKEWPEKFRNFQSRVVLTYWVQLLVDGGWYDDALQVADQLIATVPNLQPGQAIPFLWLCRGQALTGLRRLDEAEADLKAGLAEAETQGVPNLIWRLHLALGQLYRRRRRRKLAEHEFARVRGVAADLASRLDDPALRAQFLGQVEALIVRRAARGRSQASARQATR